MQGTLLCARGEEDLVVCTAEDVACVWDDLEVYDSGVVVASILFLRVCSCMRMGPST
jgi:hypothetical protein